MELAIEKLRSASAASWAPLWRILSQPVWLPRPLYELLPFAYLLLGGAALSSALFLPEPAWVMPYGLLLGIGAVHAAVALTRLRLRRRDPRYALRRRAIR